MTDTIRNILNDLERVRENLLGLSEEIWLSIDHNDSEAMEEGVAFKREYNEKMTAYDRLSDELSDLVRRFTQMEENEEEDEADAETDMASRDRIIQELDRETPHALSEDFRFKRPYGFVLENTAARGLRTWRRLYARVLEELEKRDGEKYQQLPELPDFITRGGHKDFSRSPEDLRNAMALPSGLYAEVNLSANAVKERIRKLLEVFGIPETAFRLYLREDRDVDGGRSHEDLPTSEPMDSETHLSNHPTPDEDESDTKEPPARFHGGCIERLSAAYAQDIIRVKGQKYQTTGGEVRFTLGVSKWYEQGDSRAWFRFDPVQREFLSQAESGYACFACGSPNVLFALPLQHMDAWIPQLNATEGAEEGSVSHWHIFIRKNGDGYQLHTRQEFDNVDITPFLVSSDLLTQESTLGMFDDETSTESPNPM